MRKAIFFDLDGTLFDRAATHLGYCRDLMSRHPAVFPPERTRSDLATLMAGADAPGWNRRRFARRVAQAFPALGSAPALSRDHAERSGSFQKADPAVADLLMALAQRYRVAIVTDGSASVQRAKLARLGLASETPRAFISGEIGAAKPDPAPFLAALAWAGCRPDQAWFVGDDPERDIAGASAVGMATCWVSGGRTYPVGGVTPDRTIRHVAELPGEIAR